MNQGCKERPIMCFISQQAGQLDGEIKYCPVHAAAPELLKAAKIARDVLATLEVQGTCQGEHGARMVLESAIAKAEKTTQ
jgi:hypothetical protein